MSVVVKEERRFMGSKRLVYGVGINDADYVVQVNETIGYVDGKWCRCV